MHYLHDRKLSPKAEELLQFDMDSIRLIVAAEHRDPPTIWLANPEQYESNGRVWRDSTSPRLLAYSPQYQTLYACDGCNACAHHLSGGLHTLTPEALRSFADESEIRPELLERMADLLRLTKQNPS